MARAGPRKVSRYGEQFKAIAVKLSALRGVKIKNVAVSAQEIVHAEPYAASGEPGAIQFLHRHDVAWLTASCRR